MRSLIQWLRIISMQLMLFILVYRSVLAPKEKEKKSSFFSFSFSFSLSLSLSLKKSENKKILQLNYGVFAREILKDVKKAREVPVSLCFFLLSILTMILDLEKGL